MNYIDNLITRDSVVGDVAVQPLDQNMFSDIKGITDLIGCKTHSLELYASELNTLNTDILVEEATILIMAHQIDVLFSPTFASYNKLYKSAGTVAIRAAMQAATLQTRTIDVFEAHNTGWQGNWAASGDFTRQKYTYTRHRIGAVMTSQLTERMVASLI